MVRDHGEQPPARASLKAASRPSRLVDLVVDDNAQCLEHARGYVATATSRHRTARSTAAVNSSFVWGWRSENERAMAPGETVLTVGTQQPDEVVKVRRGEYCAAVIPLRRVHAHVEGASARNEKPTRLVELM